MMSPFFFLDQFHVRKLPLIFLHQLHKSTAVHDTCYCYDATRNKREIIFPVGADPLKLHPPLDRCQELWWAAGHRKHWNSLYYVKLFVFNTSINQCYCVTVIHISQSYKTTTFLWAGSKIWDNRRGGGGRRGEDYGLQHEDWNWSKDLQKNKCVRQCMSERIWRYREWGEHAPHRKSG